MLDCIAGAGLFATLAVLPQRRARLQLQKVAKMNSRFADALTISLQQAPC
jgi:hypothetical protein